MIFTKNKIRPPDVHFKIGSDSLSRVLSCQFLGVNVDEKLNWKTHINILANKLSKVIGILCKS